MPKMKSTAAHTAAVSGILTREEIEEARKQARAKVQKEKKKSAMDAIVEEELEMARIEEGLIELDPMEEIQEVHVDLAPFQDRIVLDGRIYMHNGDYKVRKAVADVLRESCHRSWRHQAEIKGERGTRAEDIYKPRNTVVSPIHGVVNAARPAA